jgi:hypothetical protein
MVWGRKRLPDSEATHKDLTELHAWLYEHGVSKHMTQKIVDESGCTAINSFAMYLRFQLPPIQLANRDSISSELRALLGVRPYRAHQIVADLKINGMPGHLTTCHSSLLQLSAQLTSVNIACTSHIMRSLWDALPQCYTLTMYGLQGSLKCDVCR